MAAPESVTRYNEFVGVASFEDDAARSTSAMIGQSPVWLDVVKNAMRVAPLDAIQRASIVCDGSVIREGDLSLAPPPATAADSTNLDLLEQRAIERALREARGNRSKAARRLGIARTQLYQRLRKYGLEDASL